MIKNDALLRGSSRGLSAVIQLDASVNFLADRQEGIDVAPLKPESHMAYVWKRIFLKKGGARA